MATILEFKRDAKRPHHRNNDVAVAIQPKTFTEVFLECREDVLGNWQRAAVKNSLNEFFYSKIPHFARVASDSDYVNDLTVLSFVEQKLDMVVAVFYPGATPNNPFGYLAAFSYHGEIYSTTPDILSEGNARALSILFYLHFTQQIKSLGWV